MKKEVDNLIYLDGVTKICEKQDKQIKKLETQNKNLTKMIKISYILIVIVFIAGVFLWEL